MASGGERSVELRYLITLGQIRIEVVLAREHGDRVHRAVQGDRRARGQLHGALVEYGQGSRQREAYRAGIHVGRRSVFRGATTEGLAARLELHVHLEADHHLPLREQRLQSARAHDHASAPSARSRAYATVNIFSSSNCEAMSWPPMGRPSTRPIGCDIAGTPARFAVAVKMSLRYIS